MGEADMGAGMRETSMRCIHYYIMDKHKDMDKDKSRQSQDTNRARNSGPLGLYARLRWFWELEFVYTNMYMYM